MGEASPLPVVWRNEPNHWVELSTSMRKALPVFDMVIDEEMDSDARIDAVALVPNPAIQKNFVAFNDAKNFTFAEYDGRRIISGAAMLADTPIYRRDAKLGEYFVKFTADNVEKACKKFFKCGFQKSVNLFHDSEQMPDGVTIFESFIADPSRGIAPMAGFEDTPPGSWFISMSVENDAVWARIKSGEFMGFSIEGLFGMQPSEPTETGIDTTVPLTPDEISQIIEQINSIASSKIPDESKISAIQGILDSLESD